MLQLEFESESHEQWIVDPTNIQTALVYQAAKVLVVDVSEVSICTSAFWQMCDSAGGPGHV